jgi:transposase
MRKIEQISISAADRDRLQRLVRDRNTPQKVVWRARIVLLASDGPTAEGIAAAVGKSLLTVRRWRRRYVAKGVDGLLKDATRPSRVKPLTPEKVKQVVHRTLHEKPPNATHWSLRSMAAAAGISYSSVQRIWRAHGLKPHLIKTFKVSRDRNFATKVQDVVGLYLNPPDKALVLCVDYASLRRGRPGYPGTFSPSMNRSFRASRSRRLSNQLDACMMAGRGGEASITREQRSVERLGEGDVDGVVSREIVPQIPDARQKEIMRISVHGKIREIGESRAATFTIDLAVRRISPNHLRDFDVEQMRSMQRLSRVE